MLLQRLPVCFGIVAFGISIFFSREIPKILIFIELRALVCWDLRKILRRKDLQAKYCGIRG